MIETLQEVFRLREVEVKPSERVLVVLGQNKRVEPKAMDVLLTLARAGGSVVSREEIINEVWPRGFVTDDALNRCISNLRGALDDDARSPRFIATVPRRGYHLVRPVEPLPPSAPGAGMLVLPFQTLSSVEIDYLADGLTELLITRLAVGLDRPAISRTTAMRFRNTRQICARSEKGLGVRWIVEGSVLQDAGHVQVVIQLIDATIDAHIWAECWSRPLENVLTLLNEVTRRVAGCIGRELVPGWPVPREQDLRLICFASTFAACIFKADARMDRCVKLQRVFDGCSSESSNTRHRFRAKPCAGCYSVTTAPCRWKRDSEKPASWPLKLCKQRQVHGRMH